MFKASTFVPLVIGLGAGVYAVWSYRSAIEDAQKSAEPTAEVPIVVTKTAIPYACEITADMLKTVKFGSFPLEGNFDDSANLIGRVTSTKIVENVPLMANMLAEEGTLAGPTFQIPDGQMLFSLSVESSSVELIEPGDHVAVTYTPKNPNNLQLASQVILQYVEVYSVGDLGPGENRVRKAPGGKSTKRRSERTTTVFILVPKEVVTYLNLLKKRKGAIDLFLRGDGDLEDLPSPMKVEEPLADTGSKVPAEIPTARPGHEVEVFRGGVKDTLTFKKPVSDRSGQPN